MPEPVNPEIEKLRWDAKMLHGKPAGTVWLADAEAAVLACEKRMAAHAAGVRQRTVAEIVEWLRTDNPDNPRILTTFRVAEMIEQRFGVEKGEDDA